MRAPDVSYLSQPSDNGCAVLCNLDDNSMFTVLAQDHRNMSHSAAHTLSLVNPAKYLSFINNIIDLY
jgi:hypothetical protein